MNANFGFNKETVLLFLFAAFVVWLLMIGQNARSEQAHECIADGGQWVQISRDYFECIYSRAEK